MSLAAAIYAVMLQLAPLGRGLHSMEPVPACGTSSSAAACELAPVCAERSVLCEPPIWSDTRKAWVRHETADGAKARFRPVSEAMADAVEAGRSRWPGTATSLAAAVYSASYWSTGFREDIQVGAKRGPAGEVCLMDLQPGTLAWATPGVTIDQVVGRDYESLRRCFDAGVRVLVSSRLWADKACSPIKGSSTPYNWFAKYGTGSQCHTYGLLGDYARKRERTFARVHYLLAIKLEAA